MASLQQRPVPLVSRCKPSLPAVQRGLAAPRRPTEAGSRRWRRQAAEEDGSGRGSGGEEPGQEVPLWEQARMLNDLFFSSSASEPAPVSPSECQDGQDWHRRLAGIAAPIVHRSAVAVPTGLHMATQHAHHRSVPAFMWTRRPGRGGEGIPGAGCAALGPAHCRPSAVAGAVGRAAWPPRGAAGMVA